MRRAVPQRLGRRPRGLPGGDGDTGESAPVASSSAGLVDRKDRKSGFQKLEVWDESVDHATALEVPPACNLRSVYERLWEAPTGGRAWLDFKRGWFVLQDQHLLVHSRSRV